MGANEDGGPRGIPSVVGIDHVAYNVPQMADAVRFFTDLLGCWIVAGPRQSRFPATGGLVTTALLRHADGTTFELLQWHDNDGVPAAHALTGPSGYHLALTVTDLDAALAYLRAIPDIAVAPPDQSPDGQRRTFFTTPWGMVIQLITPRP